MAIEIERKFFLQDELPSLSDLPVSSIRQGYLAVEKDGNVVRVREKAGRYLLTVKTPGAMQREEVEFEIDSHTFEELWPLTSGRRIEKKRYIKNYGGFEVEIDEYLGPLAGLYTAEIEFTSASAANRFNPPAWLGTEVTHDHRFKNMNLALLQSIEELFDGP